jgi:hypothetical protein
MKSKVLRHAGPDPGTGDSNMLDSHWNQNIIFSIQGYQNSRFSSCQNRLDKNPLYRLV